MHNSIQNQNSEKELIPLYELKRRVIGKWHHIFTELAPQMAEALANAPDHVPCPGHGGFDGYRLFEHYPETGRGICNSCGPQKSGFETLAFAKGYALEDAFREVADWLRVEQSAPAPIVREPVVIRPRVDPTVAFRRISEVWRSSLAMKGTPAELYLEKRGIWKQNLPTTLRAHKGLHYVHGRERTYFGEFPVLLAPIKDKDGRIVSIHRIFLSPDGEKAPVPDPKKMMSQHAEIRGAAIKLFQPGEVLGVAEGIETALAVHAISRMPMWACVSAVLMEMVDIPASVKHVVIWADLDISERGIQAAEKLADRLEAQGKTVEICVPQGPIPDGTKGVDWLDVMLTKGLPGFPAKWRRWRPEMVEEAA